MFKRAFIVPCEGFSSDKIKLFIRYGEILYSETIIEDGHYYELIHMRCSLFQAIKISNKFIKKEKGVYYGRLA